jgi:CTD kinase subunit gamma
MHFIEHLCDMSERENHTGYVRMMQRDIGKIVDAVAPLDGTGAANVKVVRKVLNALGKKNHLLMKTVTEIEELLKERSAAPDHVGLSSPVGPMELEMEGTTDSLKTKSASSTRLDKKQLEERKKQIEDRIEEDRERHKRSRENQWATPAPTKPEDDSDPEVNELMETTSEVGSDDFRMMEEEEEQRLACLKEHMEELDAAANGTAAE